MDGRKPKKFILEASPRNLQARTVVRAAFRVPFDSPHFPGHVFTKPQWPLFEYPVPNAGFIIPGVIGMGLIASYWLGFETTIAGGANFSWGYQVSMPDTAKFSINVLDWPERSAVGFDGTSFEPVFDVHSFQGTVRFSGSSSLKLNFGIKLAKIGDYEVGMRVLAPDGGIVLTRIDGMLYILFLPWPSGLEWCLLTCMSRRPRCLRQRAGNIEPGACGGFLRWRSG